MTSQPEARDERGTDCGDGALFTIFLLMPGIALVFLVLRAHLATPDGPPPGFSWPLTLGVATGIVVWLLIWGIGYRTARRRQSL